MGNVPLFPPSAEYYESLVRAALNKPSIDCLYMLGVPKTGGFWDFLTNARIKHPEWLVYMPEHQCFYFYIDMTTSYEEYSRKFRASTRQKFRQKLRLLEKEGNVDLVRVHNADDALQFIEATCAIAKKSWQRLLMGIEVDKDARRLDLLKSMAQLGILRSYMLKVGNNVAAYLTGFQCNRTYYAFETAFDEAFAGTRLSPGQVLFYLAIKDCFEVDKPDIFHFGPGTRKEIWYKTLFANRAAEEVNVIVLKNTIANRVKIATHDIFEKSKLMVSRKLKGAHLTALSH
jgi:CelD/BcsL family acetyltransferase involved in cellulose biosynthesis